MRVDCNEVGFTGSNVEAICRIAQSTKKTEDHTKGFIGEKGIGFKSVFKVADVVWISSNNYSFKFDREKILGMITPIWDPFPIDHLQPGKTQFYLLMAAQSDELNIKKELESLDSTLLLFLRKLRRIKISTTSSLHFSQHDEPQHCVVLSRSRREICGGEALELRRRDGDASTSDLYIIIRHNVTNLPIEEKRPKVSESEIVLAFPVNTSNQPVVRDQKVHAFLPIRRYGFAVRLGHL